MKWEKAVKKIESAVAEGKKVVISYHRKYMTNLPYVDTFYDTTEYDWSGKTCTVINTYHDQIDEATHIIDKVEIREEQ